MAWQVEFKAFADGPDKPDSIYLQFVFYDDADFEGTATHETLRFPVGMTKTEIEQSVKQRGAKIRRLRTDSGMFKPGDKMAVGNTSIKDPDDKQVKA